VVVGISSWGDVELPDLYENCDYQPNDQELTCLIAGETAPGDIFTIDEDTPLKVKVEDRAPGPWSNGVYVRVMPLSDDEAAAASRIAGKAGGKQLRLTKSVAARSIAPDLNDFDNFTEFFVDVPKQIADSVAIGAGIGGAVGDKKTVDVGIRNDGPFDLLGPSDEWASSAVVTLPSGVKVLEIEEMCTPIVDGHPQWDDRGKAKGLVYYCGVWNDGGAGESITFPFKVEIVGAPGAAGSIVVDGGVQDPNTANNTAAITLTGGTGGGGGELPVTGARAGLVAGVGALLVAAGLALVMLRRRRIVTIAD
jgi:LPXTG-motif cell wall-anchored protein